MDVLILGAGRLSTGGETLSLKTISDLNDIHYLGWYHVNDVIENYPQLDVTVIPDWEKKRITHFLKSSLY